MSKVLNQITAQLQPYLAAENTQFTVAYSGGVDSHVLLHAMVKMREQFPQHEYSAVHVNHGISENSDTWQAHCECICQQLNVPLLAKRLALEIGNRESLEAVARAHRYSAISELIPSGGIILLAQHQDDQLETFLLQLKRGAGPKGLSAMGTESHKQGQTYVRPMLNVSKTDILRYAKKHKLHWVEDESNQDGEIDRNFLRLQILPQLQKRWPSIAATVSRSANLCSEQTQLLEECAAEKLKTVKRTDNALAINALLCLSQAWQNQVIRHWLDTQAIPLPSSAVLNEVPKLLTAEADANPCVRWQQWQFRRFRQGLYVLPLIAETPDYTLAWQGQEVWELPDRLGCIHIRSEQFASAVSIAVPEHAILEISFGQLTESFKPDAQSMSKPVKQWFKQWQIPPWHRGRIPMLYVNERLTALLLDNQVSLAKQVGTSENQLFIAFSSSAPAKICQLGI